ncbi:MAG TPA: SDR family oxidoreductase [Beijerinckiaceae bacterium]|nr:SDR family oxidoreductase [Beijerinckiaceae bacterium]
MKAALITGGAKRIGAAIAAALAAGGYRIALHCHRSRHEAEALAGRLRLSGSEVAIVTADLADPTALPGLVADAASALGPLTLLVNNAALFEDDRIGRLDPALFDRQMAVNLRAPLLLAEAFARQAPVGADASVVNLVDQRVLRPTPDHVSYGLSKAALWAATQMMAQALAPTIRVNAVAPGPALPNWQEGEAAFARESAALPLARPVSPDHIAEAVVFLAGAVSTTGQMIAVDGGQHLSWRTPDVLAREVP